VSKHNGWLTYGDECHRLREFGASFKEMDLIDESPLGSEQMRTILTALLDTDLPHPDVDFMAFSKKIQACNKKESPIYDPLAKAFAPLVNVEKLAKKYNSAGSVACTMC